MEFRFPTAKAVDRLNRELHLPARGGEQDWEIELADANRLEEFAAYYAAASLDDDDRFALMSLIVASAQDRLESSGPGPWFDKILAVLRQRPDLADPIVALWSRDTWAITPYLEKYTQQEGR